MRDDCVEGQYNELMRRLNNLRAQVEADADPVDGSIPTDSAALREYWAIGVDLRRLRETIGTSNMNRHWLESELEQVKHTRSLPIDALKNAKMSFHDSLEVQRFARAPRKISAPPGMYLTKLSRYLGSQRTRDECYAQTISDMRSEYFDALSRECRWEARVVLARGYWAFWTTAFLVFKTHVLNRVVGLYKFTK